MYSLFSLRYKLISPTLAEGTRSRVQIFGANDDHMSAITQDINPDQIPDWLGGTSVDCTIGAGGDVPVGIVNTNAVKQGGAMVDIEIKHGKIVPVKVSVVAGMLVTWAWVLQQDDIDFYVTDAASVNVVHEKSRISAKDGPQEGRYVAVVDGNICLNFDNYYSWMANKQISYRVEYKESDETSVT